MLNNPRDLGVVWFGVFGEADEGMFSFLQFSMSTLAYESMHFIQTKKYLHIVLVSLIR
jgi:hypothetical protein